MGESYRCVVFFLRNSINLLIEKKMKKILFAAIALMFSVSLFAQAPQQRGGERGPRPEFKPEEIATRLANEVKKDVNLTDTQYKAVYNIYLTRTKAMKAEQEKRKQEGQEAKPSGDPKKDREARFAEMKKQQEEMNNQLKQILTEKQYQKYEEAQKKKMEQRRQGPPPGGFRGPQQGAPAMPRQE